MPEATRLGREGSSRPLGVVDGEEAAACPAAARPGMLYSLFTSEGSGVVDTCACGTKEFAGRELDEARRGRAVNRRRRRVGDFMCSGGRVEGEVR
jgi:hypothetical protein